MSGVQTLDQRLADLTRLRNRVDDEIVQAACGADLRWYAETAILAAAHFGVSGSELFTPDRHQEIVDARAVVFYVARLAGESLPRIGRAMGRDHTTVLHHCRRVEATPRLRAVAERIAAGLGWDREAAS